MRRHIAVVLTLLVYTLQSGEARQGPPPTAGAPPGEAARELARVSDVVLVGFHPGASPASRAAARAAAGAVAAERLSLLTPDAQKLRLPPGRSVADAIKALAQNPAVRYAEPDYVVQTLAASSDPYYTDGSLWGMYGDQTTPASLFGSQASEAWAAGYVGSNTNPVYVGIIDEGIDTTHVDLSNNIWTNAFDPPGGGDNDGNGYVDDVHGWDFFNNDASVYDAGGDAHGTHVSGTIGADGGNGIGVAGVNWNIRMISAKFLGPSGGSTSDAVRAVDYLTALKLNPDPLKRLNIVATNNSWGGGGFSQALLDAINRGGDAGILFVAAAGNSSNDNDVATSYPSGYQCTTTAAGTPRGWDCIVSVASITSAGGLSSFSSYGATTVELGAPGSGIWSTTPGNTYANYSGTSMATPHVSGAVALCASINPSLSAVELRNAVLSSAAPTTSLAGKTATGGRLDIGSMVASWCPPPAQSAPTGTISNLAVIEQTITSIRLQWTDSVVNETSFQIQRASSCSGTFVTVGWAAADSQDGDTETYVDSGLSPSTGYCYRAIGTNSKGNSGASNTVSTATLDPPAPYVSEVVESSWIDARQGGVKLALGDDASATVTLPFQFSFYDTPVNSVTVSSNGFLRFTSGMATQFNNTAIPLATDPNGIVAPFWDDLNPAAANPSDGVFTQTIGVTPGQRQFVVAWVNVPHYNVGGSDVSVEVVIDEATDAITFQYQDVDVGNVGYDGGASATIGIEDALGTSGTLFSYNVASVTSAAAYRFTRSTTPPPPPPPPATLVVTTTSLASGTVGTSYSQTLVATGGQTPYAWSVATGSLPPDLVLNTTSGGITGTPTAAGTFSFRAQVVDSGTPQQMVYKDLSIAVVLPPPPGAFSKSQPGNNAKKQSRTPTLSWGTSQGASTYQYCYDTTNDNGCSNWRTVTGTSVTVNPSLSRNTAYYWQVRANNAGGTTQANGGTWWKFTTR